MGKSVPKRRHIKFRRRGIPQTKEYNIRNAAKVWNQEHIWSFSPSRRARVSYVGTCAPLWLYVHRMGADMSEGDGLARTNCKHCVQRWLVCVSFGLMLHTSSRQAQFGDYIRSGDLYFKAIQLSAVGKPYEGRNRKIRWGPGWIVSDGLTSTICSFVRLIPFYLPMWTVTKEANVSVKHDSRYGYAHGHVMVSSRSWKTSFASISTRLSTPADTLTSRAIKWTKVIFQRIPYLTQKKSSYYQTFIVLSFLNTFKAKTPDSSAARTFIVNTCTVPTLSDRELTLSYARAMPRCGSLLKFLVSGRIMTSIFGYQIRYSDLIFIVFPTPAW
jgi:hypothetical protein